MLATVQYDGYVLANANANHCWMNLIAYSAASSRASHPDQATDPRRGLRVGRSGVIFGVVFGRVAQFIDRTLNVPVAPLVAGDAVVDTELDLLCLDSTPA